MTPAELRGQAGERAAVVLRPAAGVAVAMAPTVVFADGLLGDGGRREAWRATESSAARRLLRWLLAREAVAVAAGAPVAARPGGQPYLEGRPDLHISLSHTDGHVAAAIGTGLAVGVDVQAPVPVSPAVIRRCCLPAVREELARLPEAQRRREFACIWTVQEACVKAAGSGLAGRPWSIPVGRGQREGEWQGHRWVSLRGQSVVAFSVAYADGPR